MDAEHHIEGFAVPVHHALTEPILLAGAPRSFAILNGTVSAAIGLGLQQWIAGVILFFAGHTFAVFVAKRDAEFMTVMVRHIRHKGWWRC